MKYKIAQDCTLGHSQKTNKDFKKGEIVTLLSTYGEIAIIQDKENERHSINKNHLIQ